MENFGQVLKKILSTKWLETLLLRIVEPGTQQEGDPTPSDPPSPPSGQTGN
jgi:hypothetical protein